MAEGRGRFEWERTSSLMALVVNLMRNPQKTKPVAPADFNPYHPKTKPIPLVPLIVLRDVFIKEKNT